MYDLKHNRSETCMPSRFHTNDNTIIFDNYDNALHIIKHNKREPMSIEECTTYVIGTIYTNRDC